MGVYDVNGNDIMDVSSVYEGKRLSILGDSISTYEGYSGGAYYDGTNCGVQSVNDTWWMKLLTALGMTLEKNNSISGTKVTTGGYISDDKAGCMTRCQDLGAAPDVIIVYMGINDFSSNTDIGTYNGTVPLTSDTTKFRDAYAIMLDKIMTKYSHAEVWCATLMPKETVGSIGVPEINTSGAALREFNEAIEDISLIFGAKVMDFARCGLTYENMPQYMGDYNTGTKNGLHPNASGHSLLANQAIRQMDSFCRKRY